MKRQKFVYTAHAGDNTKFVYIPKMEQKANFVYKELYAIVSKMVKTEEEILIMMHIHSLKKWLNIRLSPYSKSYLFTGGILSCI